MKVAAVVHPTGLLSKELRERLDERPDLVREQRLLTMNEGEVGVLTESGGSAAVVQRFDADALEGVDILFLCGSAAESRRVLAAAAPGTRAVILSLDATPADAPALVAGVNLGDEAPAPVVLSPHPAAVLLAHLLHPLRAHGLRQAEATLLQPVSIFAADALDQLFEETRNLLTFQPTGESPHWPRQLAFNALATPETAEVVRVCAEAVLGDGAALSAQLVQVAVFHGFAASVHFRCEPDPGIEALREVWTDRPFVRWADEEPLGPVDAAASEDVLLGHVRGEAGRAGSYWLWAVMDNLTRGGAANALAIAETLLR